MSSITAANQGVTDLLKTISTVGSSALSSTAVQSALQNARPADLVQLTEQALQLLQTASLLGNPETASVSTDPGTQLLQALSQQATASQSNGSASVAAPAGSAETPAEQVASGLAAASGDSTVSYLG